MAPQHHTHLDGRPLIGAGAVIAAALVVVVILVAAVGTSTAAAQEDDDVPTAPADELTVVTTELSPFVVRDRDRPDGFYAEIWSEVARELGVNYEVRWVESFPALIDELEAGRADVAVAPLAPTAERETRIDFTSAVIASGPALGYHSRIEESSSLLGAIFTSEVLSILLVALAGLVVLGHLIWLTERGADDGHFHPSYVRGIGDGVWWAAVTVTTVGYGDKSPSTRRGKTVALVAMLLSLFLVSAFVSQITTILQGTRVAAPFDDLESLGDRPVGVVEGSSFAAYLEGEGANVVGYDTQTEVFLAAADGEIDAVVANPFALADDGPRHGITQTGDLLYDEFETFGVAQGSPWREPINQALAVLHADGEVGEIVARWQD